MKALARQTARKRAGMIISILFFGGIGLYFTWRLLAAPLGIIIEAENSGAITQPAQKITVADAAGGQAVRFSAPTPTPTPPTPPPSGSYDSRIIADNPVLFLPLSATGTNEPDQSPGHSHTATYKPGTAAKATMPNGDKASIFNAGNYVEVPDADDLSVTNKGYLTIEAWMRPDVLNFSRTEAEGYVHWMGKGVAGQHEYVSRIYNQNSGRPNRISGYLYKLSGGLGAGSYFQDNITAGQWIYYTIVIDIKGDFIRIYRDGVQRDQDALLNSEYGIVPGNGTAPFRVGTRDFNSFFQGAIGKVAIYNYALSGAQISAHYNAMK